MSFTSDIKKELTMTGPGKKCCQLAQISGFLRFAGSITLMGGIGIRISTENPAVARCYASMIKSYFGSKTSLSVEESSSINGGRTYGLSITPDMNAEAILRETGILSVKEGSNYITDGMDPMIVKKRCCKKAALRGIFMASGSVSGLTTKGYHMQIVCASRYMADDVRKLLSAFGLKARVSGDEGRYIVYLKEGEQIADFLSVVGATNQMFEYQNVMINRQMKNKLNRISNCENANLDKTVAAAQKQLADIRLVESVYGASYLPAKLREAAELRKENPELSLAELAGLFDPPLKKSGLNHRFAKIAEMAEEIRKSGR
ncbi:MAG: DNA-binding protein WhiA [Firmicutes bacterium]|nr:DNA-binding protein WhiA [Bacillota bacterium]